MVQWHRLALAGHAFQRDRLGPFAARRHHHPKDTLVDQVGTRTSEPGREQAVRGRRRSAALYRLGDGL
jgi:hypothetical protein